MRFVPPETPKPGDYVVELTFPKDSITADGFKIMRRTYQTPALWEEVARVKDRLAALAEARRLAADAGVTAWTYELDDTFLKLHPN